MCSVCILVCMKSPRAILLCNCLLGMEREGDTGPYTECNTHKQQFLNKIWDQDTLYTGQ